MALYFGILKYLHSDPDIRKKLTNLPSADLNFNYLGQFDAGAAAQNNSPKVPFRQAQDNVGPEQHPEDKRSAQLYFVAAVSGGQLHTRWLYSQNVFKGFTIKRIAKKYLIELSNILKFASGITK